MESWKGLNYYTRDPIQWVQLMNLSTVEWGIGYLPRNLYAIPGTLNSSYDIPDDAILIQHAAETESGSRDTEKIIFGVASGIVILAMGCWLWFNWHDFVSPEARDRNPEPEAGSSTTVQSSSGESVLDHDRFINELSKYYDLYAKSHLEAVERDIMEDGFAVEDIEAVSKLLRSMFTRNITLWTEENSPEMTDERRNKLMRESEAILEEVHRRVSLGHQAIADRRTMGEDGQMEEINRVSDYLQRYRPVQSWQNQSRGSQQRNRTRH
ncbi:hypothetical protein F66182_453 [Fusarium sp. NRRL 66182]|nr:hypothetical protein F66182_453 [Fusarium sp. NRRL 66182]